MLLTLISSFLEPFDQMDFLGDWEIFMLSCLKSVIIRVSLMSVPLSVSASLMVGALIEVFHQYS